MNVLPSRFLLWALIAAIALRFGALPWLAWQDDTRAELEVLTQRLDRSAGVIENGSAIESSMAALNVRADQLRALFRRHGDAEEFKLAIQQEVGAWYTEGGARIEVFDWVIGDSEGRSRSATSAQRVRARIQVGGTLRSLAMVHGRLESALPTAAIREIRLRTVSSAENLPDSTASMTIVVDFFYIRAKPDDAAR